MSYENYKYVKPYENIFASKGNDLLSGDGLNYLCLCPFAEVVYFYNYELP